ncbi:MAG: amino acid synthesis family protein [Glaciimonas sp.]|nr:amino acid synthesis family protein [Glaciimonas sp.]
MTKPSNFETYHIRKWYTQIDETLANENGILADGASLKKITIAAAIQNPYAGKYSENLEQILNNSPALGKEFGRCLVAALAGEEFESYGKSCIVGSNGEYEHGNAFLTPIMVMPIREALGGGKAWIPSSGKRGVIGTEIDIPLAHKNALYVPSHYDTVTTKFFDAPMSDEVVVIFSVATRGRLHARLGGLKAGEIVGQDGLR